MLNPLRHTGLHAVYLLWQQFEILKTFAQQLLKYLNYSLNALKDINIQFGIISFSNGIRVQTQVYFKDNIKCQQQYNNFNTKLNIQEMFSFKIEIYFVYSFLCSSMQLFIHHLILLHICPQQDQSLKYRIRVSHILSLEVWSLVHWLA